MFIQTYSTNVLPLNLISVSPGEGFTYLPLPPREGIHTGGLWRSPDGKKVWKPLDARPYANSDFRVPTLEATCLAQLQGQIGFIDNWQVKESNGRWWLIRPYCKVVGQTFPVEQLTQDIVEQVEEAVRALNAHHWEAFQADDLTVAIDPHTQLPFLLDLSNAHPKSAQGNWKADDSDSLYKWMKAVGWESLAELREQGRSLLYSKEWMQLTQSDEQYDYHKHVYRLKHPISTLTGGIQLAYKEQCWWVLPYCISPDLCDRYKAEWAWSPIPYQAQPQWLALENLLDQVESYWRNQSDMDTYNPDQQQADINLVTEYLRQVKARPTALLPSDFNALHAPFVLEHQEHSDDLMWKGKPTGWLIMDKIS
jgi:hypothetical protein